MEGKQDRRWQIRLSNVFVSVALFGLAIASGKEWYGIGSLISPRTVFPHLIMSASTFLLFGSAIGMAFGRLLRGALIGLLVYSVPLVVIVWVEYCAIRASQ